MTLYSVRSDLALQHDNSLFLTSRCDGHNFVIGFHGTVYPLDIIGYD